MKLILFTLFILFFVNSASATVLSSDDFNRGDDTDLGPLWYETWGENAIVDNKLDMTDNSAHGVVHQYEITSYPVNISMKLYNETVAVDHRARIYTNTSGNETVDGVWLRFSCGVDYTRLVVGGSYLAPNTGDGGIGEHAWEDGETIVLRIESDRVEAYIGGDYLGYWEETLGYGWVAIITDTAGFQWSIDDFSIDSDDVSDTAPNIDSYAPTTPNSTYENVAATYNATINQSTSNNEWLINGTRKEWDNATDSPEYTNSTWTPGVYNVTLITHNSTDHDLTDSQTWIVTVLINTFDYNVSYWNPGSGGLVTTFEISNITAGWDKDIYVLLNVTRDTWNYNLTYSNGTEVSNQTATSTNESLNFSIPLVEDSYNITESSTGAADTKFEYWTGSAWVEDEAQYYLWFTCFWWTSGYPDGVAPNAEQSSGQPSLKIINNGSAAGTPKMKLNESAPANVTVFVDDDNTYAGSVELTDTYQAVSTSLSATENVTIWAWVNLTGPTSLWEFEVYAINE